MKLSELKREVDDAIEIHGDGDTIVLLDSGLAERSIEKADFNSTDNVFEIVTND